ncbi:MAG: SRPBCC domain-containing protein [Hyphomonas oceanitis]|uniref:SRPBCC domain-containing protein n=1 Tax=Hyphomonas oceanitis TaxID=81033 RepID=UPI0030029F7A
MADPTALETPHEFDLVLERTIAAPAETLYRCYTEPELVCQWFCPKPWNVTEAKLDLRPGGASYHRMEGPDGEVNHVHGQYLEVVPGRRLVGTDAYVGDWVPAENSPFMTSIITFKDLGDGTTLYRAVARHWSEEAMKGHEAMGFHEGWGKAADQLEELAKSLPPEPVRVHPANPGDAHEVVPHLVCRGAAEAIAFYKQAFDAEEMIRLPGPDGRLVHASVKINTGMVMLVDEFPDMEVQSPETLGGTSVTLHLAVTDAQGVFDKAVAAGAKPLMPVARQFWGDLYGMIEDPFGHKWSIATPGENAPRTTEALQDAMMADAAAS